MHAVRRLVRAAVPDAGLGLAKRIAGAVPQRWRMGRSYWRWRAFLIEASNWPAEQVRRWQLRRLQQVVAFAYEHTEGYRELYQQAGIRPHDVRTLDDVRRLPFVTKELLRDNLKAFTARTWRTQYVTTGGSTGIPLGFHEPRAVTRMEAAFVHDAWAQTGWTLGLPTAILRGGYIGSPDRVWEYHPLDGRLHLSSYHLTDTSVAEVVRALRAHRIRVLEAYPSSLELCCDLLRDAGLVGAVHLEWIFLGSENLYGRMLNKFRSTFPGARIFSWYGHAEKVVFAPWCAGSERPHLHPFYGLAEVLADTGAPAANGEEGEIVGTGFHNLATPFVRYRTLDRAVRGCDGCPACGRGWPLLDRIEGRSHELVVGATGRQVSMTAIIMHDDTFDGIRQYQFLQEVPGRVVLRYVPAPGFIASAEAEVRSRIAEKLGPDIALEMERVGDIPRTRNGKFRVLEQRLALSRGDA